LIEQEADDIAIGKARELQDDPAENLQRVDAEVEGFFEELGKT
jgi:hypothetical protein